MGRCGHGFIIRSVRSRISAKRAYIKDCPEMMCAGFPPRLAGPARTVRECTRALTKNDKGSLTMASFSYNTAAELFPAAIRKKKRAGFAYRRFGTAAEAVRFAIEELPADSLNGAYLQVDEALRSERYPHAV